MQFHNPSLRRGTAWTRGLVAAFGLAAAMLAPSAGAAPTITVAHSTNAAQGTVEIFVNAAQFSDLFAYQFNLTFNPSVLALQSVTEGSFLGLGGTTFFDGGSITPGTDVISAVFGTLIGPVAGVDGAGVLASFKFGVLHSTTTNVAVSDVLALNSFGDEIAVTVESGLPFPVTAVPEPGTWLMLIAGLALLPTLRRRSESR